MTRSQVKVYTVDAFQGSENDIILLSLTRSNDQGLLGWANDHRRINCALTRARVCLNVFGNFQCFSNPSQEAKGLDVTVWPRIIAKVKAKGAFREHATIGMVCPKHDTKFQVNMEKDLRQLRNGFSPDFDVKSFFGGCNHVVIGVHEQNGFALIQIKISFFRNGVHHGIN